MFLTYQTFSVGGAGTTVQEHIIAEDLDGDGAKDILITDPSGSRVVVFINDIPTSIPNHVLENSFVVYPNPARDKIFFLNNTAGKKELMNCAGITLRTSHSSEMDIANLATGIYLIKIGKQIQTIFIE